MLSSGGFLEWSVFATAVLLTLLCDRVIVMRAGKIVEQGPTDRVLFSPESEYTRELLAAIPRPPH